MPRSVIQRSDGRWYLDDLGPFKYRYEAIACHEALSREEQQHERAALRAEKAAAAKAREKAISKRAIVAALKKAVRNPGTVMGRPPGDATLCQRIALEFYWTKRQPEGLAGHSRKRKPKRKFEPAFDIALIRKLSRRFKRSAPFVQLTVVAFAPLGMTKHYSDDTLNQLRARLVRVTPPPQRRSPQLRFALNQEGTQEFLKAVLANGPLPATRIYTMGKVAGLRERTIDRAKKALGVRSKRQGAAWSWVLPDTIQGCQ